MRKFFFISGIISLLIFSIYSNSFGDNQWVSIGPEGGKVMVLAIDPQTPDTLYVGTYEGGVFKSTNGGTSWNAMNTGMTDTCVLALAINPQIPNTLYAGTHGGGVFKSTNGGASWTAINTGLGSTSVNILAINPQTPDTLYAGTWDGVFKSTNGGVSWTAVNTGLTNTTGLTDTMALAINPQIPDTLYAGTYGGGVFKSTHGGTSWTAMNTGMTDTYVMALAIDPQTPDTLYAGTDGGGAFKTQTIIYVSLDGVCSDKTPCFAAIQNGIDSAQSLTVINITQETYNENVVLNSPKELTLQGGWDATFTSCLSKTTIHGSLTISNGKLILENIVLQ